MAPDLTDKLLRDSVQHEKEHGTIAAMMGAKSVRYILELWKLEGGFAWQMQAQPLKVQTTKLGLAAFQLYPYEPSAGDILDAQGLGYTGGVDEVGYKINAYNNHLSAKQPLPLPLSYKQPNKKYLV